MLYELTVLLMQYKRINARDTWNMLEMKREMEEWTSGCFTNEMMICTSSYRSWRYSLFLATLVTTCRWYGETFVTRTTPAKKIHSSSSPTLSTHSFQNGNSKGLLVYAALSFKNDFWFVEDESVKMYLPQKVWHECNGYLSLWCNYESSTSLNSYSFVKQIIFCAELNKY